MRLIDADDLLEHAEVNGESEEFVNKLSDYIKDAPRARGVWRRSAEDDMCESGICSHCGWDTCEAFGACLEWYRFCPRCGAEMGVNE